MRGRWGGPGKKGRGRNETRNKGDELAERRGGVQVEGLQGPRPHEVIHEDGLGLEVPDLGAVAVEIELRAPQLTTRCPPTRGETNDHQLRNPRVDLLRTVIPYKSAVLLLSEGGFVTVGQGRVQRISDVLLFEVELRRIEWAARERSGPAATYEHPGSVICSPNSALAPRPHPERQ
eukprot:3674206-Pyramimonas_sp.AAC.1